jgi:hypothetical protein
MTLSDAVLMDGAIGLLAGLLIGFIVAAWRDRGDTRLWRRDQIARAAGAPVLASLVAETRGGAGGRLRLPKVRLRTGSPHARTPGGAEGWVRFFKDFDPMAGSSWQLRTVLDRLAAAPGTGDTGGSVTVLSVSSDSRALILGPQLAAFSATTGTRTALVLGPQQPPADAAGLRAVASASGPDGQLGNLRILTPNPAGDDWSQRDVQLNVIVVAVDGGAPAVPRAIGAVPTVLAVSAGGATREDLARVAAAARKAGSRIAGVIVGNPEAGDGTSGLMPSQAGWAARGSATRVNGRVTEMR